MTLGKRQETSHRISVRNEPRGVSFGDNAAGGDKRENTRKQAEKHQESYGGSATRRKWEMDSNPKTQPKSKPQRRYAYIESLEVDYFDPEDDLYDQLTSFSREQYAHLLRNGCLEGEFEDENSAIYWETDYEFGNYRKSMKW
jgi:hypothetical protein